MTYLSSEAATNYSLIKGLAEQALGFPASTIHPLGGVISYNFMVNKKHILKIASSRTSIADWQKNVANASVLQQKLSVQIPIPTLHQLQHNGQEIPALSYECLSGYTIPHRHFSEIDNATRHNYISQLNEKIYELHQILPNSLPVPPPSVLKQMSSLLFNNEKQRQIIVKLAESLFPYQADRQVLLHADLHTENICFDGKKITGLLDFDSLCVGHPVFEFRPKLYERKEELQFMISDYIKKYPAELSPKIVRDFSRKFNVLFFLFYFLSLVKGKRGNQTCFDEIVRRHPSINIR